RRACETWPDHVWLNPVPEAHWQHTRSIGMIQDIFENRMMPMTLEGLTQAMRVLG
ncbi:MAG: VWA domain-containing protein, partial [Paracoccus sp. (in: a-proteobacteria)]|nr:VWA domain-containing protein [Paracoccus sp. (in: a-proteobacteria)]